jgi:hypothetical protein
VIVFVIVTSHCACSIPGICLKCKKNIYTIEDNDIDTSSFDQGSFNLSNCSSMILIRTLIGCSLGKKFSIYKASMMLELEQN